MVSFLCPELSILFSFNLNVWFSGLGQTYKYRSGTNFKEIYPQPQNQTFKLNEISILSSGHIKDVTKQLQKSVNDPRAYDYCSILIIDSKGWGQI